MMRRLPTSLYRHGWLPWAALFGLVLPTSTRPGFATNCAMWPAFQAPKDDIAAGSAFGRAPPPKERFSALQQHKRPHPAAVARMLRGDIASGMHRKRIALAAGGASGNRNVAVQGVTSAAHSDTGGGSPSKMLHAAEKGLHALPLPPALAQWVDRLPHDLLTIIDTIEQGGGRVWLVGGCVRDCLSGLTPWEVDMATTMHPAQVLALFPRALDTGSEHGTVTVRKGGVSCEVTTLRAEGELLDVGARAHSIDFGMCLKHDLLRRDLTINALAVHVASRALFDPLEGQQDIFSGTLRAVGSAEDRLGEDALRAMRAYRFIDSKVGVREPDQELSRTLRRSAGLLSKVSRERVWAELRRILSGPRAPLVCSRMARDGVLRVTIHRDVTASCRGVSVRVFVSLSLSLSFSLSLFLVLSLAFYFVRLCVRSLSRACLCPRVLSLSRSLARSLSLSLCLARSLSLALSLPLSLSRFRFRSCIHILSRPLTLALALSLALAFSHSRPLSLFCFLSHSMSLSCALSLSRLLSLACSPSFLLVLSLVHTLVLFLSLFLSLCLSLPTSFSLPFTPARFRSLPLFLSLCLPLFLFHSLTQPYT